VLEVSRSGLRGWWETALPFILGPRATQAQEVQMASYKVDIINKFAKYHYSLWKAGELKPDPANKKGFPTREELLGDLRKSVDKSLAVDDTVTFRGVAFLDRAELFGEIKRADF